MQNLKLRGLFACVGLIVYCLKASTLHKFVLEQKI